MSTNRFCFSDMPNWGIPGYNLFYGMPLDIQQKIERDIRPVPRTSARAQEIRLKEAQERRY